MRPMRESDAPVDLARRAAGFSLPGVDGSPWSVTHEAWPPLLSLLFSQRIMGLAVAGAEAGWLYLTPSQSAELLTRHRDAMLWVLTLERGLVRLAPDFRAAGIDFVVLKGPAVAHGFYPDPSWRTFADLDLLVRTADWRRACALLAELGFRRDLPEPRPGFDERFGKAAAHTGTDGFSVDLHRTLVLGPFGLWIDPDVLFERTTAFRLGGVSLKRLEHTSAFLHACAHASLGWHPPLLTPVRDVAQLATGADVNWEEVEELGDRWRLGVVVHHALKTASEQLGVELPEPARGILATRPRRREARLLEAYTSDRRWRGGTAIATLRAIRGPGAKVAYIRTLLVPSKEFLVARAGVRGKKGSYLRRWMVPIKWLRGRRSHRK